jgi:hypothetical protein
MHDCFAHYGKQFIESALEGHPIEDWLGEVNLGHDEKCADEEEALSYFLPSRPSRLRG